MSRIAVLASGKGSNLQAIIDAIKEKRLNAILCCVISDRKNALVLKRAIKHNISSHWLDPKLTSSREDYDKTLIKKLKGYNPDLVVLAGFMRILSPTFVKHYKNRLINLHPSLLPSFPGLKAIEQALKYGAKVTGCTVHFVDEGVDSGPIILQKSIEIDDDDNLATLSEKIHKLEHLILVKAINLFLSKNLKVSGRVVKNTGK